MFPKLSFSVCISEMEGHLLAGFIEGESHLGIVENNGGQSMSCFLEVCARDDDQEMLEWLHAATGMGVLRRVRAHRTSRPQVSWTVTRLSECVELSRFLRRFPFFGRKRRELASWMRAVELRAGSQSVSLGELRGLKVALHRDRAYGPPVALDRRPATQAALKGYITGFVAAEGHLGIYDRRPRLSVHLRADDRPLLEMLCRESECGAVYACPTPPHLNPSCVWTVNRLEQVEKLAGWFFEADLYGRKRLELDAWADAIRECRRARVERRRRDRAVMDAARERLLRARAYAPGPQIELLSVRLDPRAETVSVLRRWAEHGQGPLSATAYMRWRAERRELPGRNTVVHRFGSWHAALVAAGLQERAARPCASVEASRAGAEAGLRRREDLRRARALDAVARCRDDLGRVPRIVDYMRWRLRGSADAPSHAGFYRLFPDGWAAVLAALAEREALGALHRGVGVGGECRRVDARAA